MNDIKLNYSVSGTIRDYDTGAPLENVKVRAYDKDFFRDQLLGDGVTDENGRYRITFSREDFTGPLIKLERHPDIFLLVFDAQDKLLYKSENSIVIEATRHITIDIGLKYPDRHAGERKANYLFGIPINLPEVSSLSAEEVLSAYKLMRNPALKLENADRIKKAFPGIFLKPTESPPECGNGILEMFRYLLKERDAEGMFDEADTDPYQGATVRQFFTANIVVKYTTDATLPGGAVNPNKLPAASATLPAADSNYTMPNGTVIGIVRANLADLDPANTEVAPIYIQKVGLLAEYALSHYINTPFSYLDPRGGLTRLEFRILGLTAGVAGYAVSSDYHMELNTSNSDNQNLGTVPHELFHLVQYRYNAGGGPANGIRGSMLEGGARLLEESINETPNRYVESAVDGDLSMSSVPRKGIFNYPEETLIDIGGSQSLLRYAAGLLWKYMAEQHSTLTGAADEPAIGVDSYRKILERMTTVADNFTITAVRNGRGQLPWYGSFDQFSYYDAGATELGSHETTWGNFLLANYFHRLWTPASPGFDDRFDYKEDDDPPGNVASLNTYSPVISAGNAITLSQGSAVTRSVTGHKPYAAVYYEITPDAASAPRMLRVNFSASGGMSNPIVQIVRVGAANALVDIHRSDKTIYSKTINMTGLTRVLVIVGSKENGGSFTLQFDEIAGTSDVMVTRWNSLVGTEFEVDPKGWSWTWISPDIMVDTNDDLMDDTSVYFGQNNKLKVRLRNRGNAVANNIHIDFWYQKATPFLTSAGWIPVQNLAGVTQSLNGLTLAPGTEKWFAVDWCPVDDGTHHDHWCVKVLVTCASDPNGDNKMAFRNFANVMVSSPDMDIQALIRYFSWTVRDNLLVVSRNKRWTLKLQNPEVFRKSVVKVAVYECNAHHITLGVPLDMRMANFKLVRSRLKEWDGKVTSEPKASHAYYAVDERTLPPGVKSNEIVTLAYVRDGRTFGGISYRISSTQKE
jgi:hypothetical protein